MKGLKPKTARRAKIEKAKAAFERANEIESRVYKLVEAGKLDEEEMKLLKAYKEMYQLKSVYKDIFGPKTMKEYKTFRETLLEKYETGN